MTNLRYSVVKLESLSEDSFLKQTLKKFCSDHGIFLPDDGECHYVYNKSYDIIAVLNVRSVDFIEPLVSKNPVVAAKLVASVLEYQDEQGKITRAIIKEDFLPTAEKVGFKREFEDLIIIERVAKWQELLKENRH